LKLAIPASPWCEYAEAGPSTARRASGSDLVFLLCWPEAKRPIVAGGGCGVRHKRHRRAPQTSINIFDPIEFSQAMQGIARVMTARIFIAYRRSDQDVAAHWIHQGPAVHYGRENVFIDVDDIKAGQDYRVQLRAALSKVNVLLVVIGKDWLERDKRRFMALRIKNKGDWVRFEIEFALKQNILTIPILINGATMPLKKQLPPELDRLRYLQSIEYNTARDSFARLTFEIDLAMTRSRVSKTNDENRETDLKLSLIDLIADRVATERLALIAKRPRQTLWRKQLIPCATAHVKLLALQYLHLAAMILNFRGLA
jgi:hypothetical protein